MARRLVKSRDRKLFGVAGGLGEYFDLDPTLVRVGFVVISFFFCGVGLVAYLALALLMPDPVPGAGGTPSTPPPIDVTPGNVEQPEQRRRNLFGLALIGLGILVVLAKLDVFPWVSWGLLAAASIAVGVVLLARRRRGA